LNGIIVFGLNGSGKTTFARELANSLNYKHMDIEDYYFIESDVPYSKARELEECKSLMLKDIEKHKYYVLSALTGDFGYEITSTFELGIFIDAPHAVRVERVRRRSIDRFGDRVKEGGDMYEANMTFMDMVESRTLSKVTEWSEQIECPIIHLDGRKNISDNVHYIKAYLMEMF